LIIKRGKGTSTYKIYTGYTLHITPTPYPLPLTPALDYQAIRIGIRIGLGADMVLVMLVLGRECGSIFPN